MADLLSSLNRNGSGIDLKALTSSLVTAEFQPRETAIQSKISQTETTISALGQVRSQLDKLHTAGDAINASPVLAATSSGVAADVQITNPSQVKETSSEIYVNALAKRQVVEFTGFTSADATLGTGMITIETGLWTDIANDAFLADPEKAVQTVNISAGMTLEDIATALNGLEGVTARVLDKGDGTFSFGIVSEVGIGSSLRLSVQEDAAAPGLAALDMTTGAESHQVQAASDAILEVDGLVVLRSSNTIDDLIPGASITLVEPGLTTVSVTRDRETAATNLEYLVINMNETLDLFKGLTSRGVNGASRGDLAGDLATQSATTALRNLMLAPINGYGDSAVTLADMGISITRDGSFEFNRTKFDSAFDANPKVFDAVFSDRLESDTPGVSISGTPATTDTYGSYEFLRVNGTGAGMMAGRPTFSSPLSGSRTEFVAFGGPLSGTTLIAEDGIANATIYHAKSFVSILQTAIDDLLSSSGQIATRETQLNENLTFNQDELSALSIKRTSAEDRYIERFTAMEVAITQLKSTGEYLTNLIDQWNNPQQ